MDKPAPHPVPDRVELRLVGFHFVIDTQDLIAKPGGNDGAFIGWPAVDTDPFRGYPHQLAVVEIEIAAQRGRKGKRAQAKAA